VNIRARRAGHRRARRDEPGELFLTMLRRARRGDEAAVAELYRLLQPRLIRYLRVMAPADAERLAFETWDEVVERLDAFDGPEAALYALGFAIARRRAGDTDGDAPCAQAEHVIDLGLTELVDEDGMAGLGLRSALAAISRLPRDQAEIVLLRVLGELTVYEVATLIDRPVDEVSAVQLEALRTLNWIASTTEARP
jgi:RNA polymerase sigma-70 factor, ECF subfamily